MYTDKSVLARIQWARIWRLLKLLQKFEHGLTRAIEHLDLALEEETAKEEERNAKDPSGNR